MMQVRDSLVEDLKEILRFYSIEHPQIQFPLVPNKNSPNLNPRSINESIRAGQTRPIIQRWEEGGVEERGRVPGRLASAVRSPPAVLLAVSRAAASLCRQSVRWIRSRPALVKHKFFFWAAWNRSWYYWIVNMRERKAQIYFARVNPTTEQI